MVLAKFSRNLNLAHIVQTLLNVTNIEGTRKIDKADKCLF